MSTTTDFRRPTQLGLTSDELSSAAYAAREYAAACTNDFVIDYWNGIADKLSLAAGGGRR